MPPSSELPVDHNLLLTDFSTAGVELGWVNWGSLAGVELGWVNWSSFSLRRASCCRKSSSSVVGQCKGDPGGDNIARDDIPYSGYFLRGANFRGILGWPASAKI